MRAIPREAGVGIATLYRHFPTRESLVEAVYRDQVVRLTTGARELLARLPRPRRYGVGWTCSETGSRPRTGCSTRCSR
ncbi:TetR/AcrR family transcriptional regulator [Amycolatopsis carbonis]|uniref:TetR/AcrR family transcriptional regulator n=1 Tax=Amycolatopsis carbonis TaxID=715471 RepID=UPI003DA7524A